MDRERERERQKDRQRDRESERKRENRWEKRSNGTNYRNAQAAKVKKIITIIIINEDETGECDSIRIYNIIMAYVL